MAEALESALKGTSSSCGGGLQTVSWPCDKHGVEKVGREGLPLGFSLHSCDNADGLRVPGLTPDDYHWHHSHASRGAGASRVGIGPSAMVDDADDIANDSKTEEGLTIAEVYFPLLAVVLPKWLNSFVTKCKEEHEHEQEQELRAAAAAVVGGAAYHNGGIAAIATNGRNRNGRKWAADSLAVSPVTSPRVKPVSSGAAAAEQQQQQQQQPKIRRVIFLVSGFGAPRNQTHATEGNSTEATARLMKRFIESCYPYVEVRLVHSDDSIFRYDTNVNFVRHHLRPGVERERDAVALTHGEEWPRRFKLTVALCDGAPARLQALMASFRDMQPYLLHMWQLKSFWHMGNLCENDVDIQRWEQAEAMPPIRADVDSLKAFFAAAGKNDNEGEGDDGGDGALVARMVEEMKRHRDVFMSIEQGGHELSTFWLRKTQKPVLAVLCVRRQSKRPRRRRIRKEDEEEEEVEEEEEDEHTAAATVVGGGGVERSRSRKRASEPEFHRGVNLEVSMPTGSLCSERNVIGTALASDPTLRREDLFGIAVLSLRKSDINPSTAGGGGGGEAGGGGGGGAGGAGAAPDTVPPTPRNGSLINLAALGGGGGRRGGETEDNDAVLCRPMIEGGGVPLKPVTDLNPLKPCGACKEWLYKIAEVNPGFKVLMFSDVNCDEVYIKSVAQC